MTSASVKSPPSRKLHSISVVGVLPLTVLSLYTRKPWIALLKLLHPVASAVRSFIPVMDSQRPVLLLLADKKPLYPSLKDFRRQHLHKTGLSWPVLKPPMKVRTCEHSSV